jgi:rubrerythrin
MNLRTASETLSFIRELEEKAAVFYEELAKRFPEKANEFLAFAKENRKYNKQIQMAYQSVITDAIEGCYAFNLESDHYTFETDLPDTASLAEAATKALAIEDKILECYTVGAEQSGSLLADVPRNFKIVVRKRNDRLEKLKSFTSS